MSLNMGNPYARLWLQGIPWDAVVALNAALCAKGGAQHGRTSDGFEATQNLWEQSRQEGEKHFADIIALCKRCHRLSPFLFYNGNTFSGIARKLASTLPLGEEAREYVVQVTGHIIAGVVPYEEERDFMENLRKRDGR
jgi:hypothetical protein